MHFRRTRGCGMEDSHARIVSGRHPIAGTLPAVEGVLGGLSGRSFGGGRSIQFPVNEDDVSSGSFALGGVKDKMVFEKVVLMILVDSLSTALRPAVGGISRRMGEGEERGILLLERSSEIERKVHFRVKRHGEKSKSEIIGLRARKEGSV